MIDFDSIRYGLKEHPPKNGIKFTDSEIDAALALAINQAAVISQGVAVYFANCSIVEANETHTFNGLTFEQAKEEWLKAGPAFWDGERRIGLLLNPDGKLMRIGQFSDALGELQTEMEKLKNSTFLRMFYDRVVQQIEEGRQ